MNVINIKRAVILDILTAANTLCKLEVLLTMKKMMSMSYKKTSLLLVWIKFSTIELKNSSQPEYSQVEVALEGP